MRRGRSSFRLAGLVASVSTLAFGAAPSQAQTVRGTPGTPSAVEFPDSRVLPIPTPPFAGTIMPNGRDAIPAWPPQIAAPADAPNILVILTDDVGFGAPSTFGGVIPTPAQTASPRRVCGTRSSTRRLCARPRGRRC